MKVNYSRSRLLPSSLRQRGPILFAAFLIVGLLCPAPALSQQDVNAAKMAYSRGIEASRTGDLPGAIHAWSRALQLLNTIEGTEFSQAECHMNIGTALQKMGRYEDAIRQQERALAILKTIAGTELDQAILDLNIGSSLCSLSRYEDAIERQEQALVIFKTIEGTEYEQAKCFMCTGFSFNMLDKHEEAIARQERALAILNTIDGTEREQAICYVNIGKALHDLGRYEDSVARQEQALALFKSIKGTERERALCHKNIGVAFRIMGRFKDSIMRQEQAYAILRAIQGSERERAECHLHASKAAHEMGRIDIEISQQEQALAIYNSIEGAERDQAGCNQNLGGALCQLGKYEDAIMRQEQALAIFRTVEGTEREQARVCVGIGSTLQFLGKHDASIAWEEQALAIYKTIEDTEIDQAVSYLNLGDSLLGLGKYEDSIERYELALAILKTIKGSERLQAGCYLGIGRVLSIIDKHEDAIGKTEQALAILTTIKGTENDQSASYMILGDSRCFIRQFDKAIGAYQKSQQLSSGVGAHLGLGNAYRRRNQLGDIQLAIEQFSTAIEQAEQERQLVTATEHRTAIFEKSAHVFSDFVALLADATQNRMPITDPEVLRWASDQSVVAAPLEAAFHFADQGKGRSLIDALYERTILNVSTPNSRLAIEDRELSLRISKVFTLREELPELDTERRKKLTDEIEELQQRRNMIEAELKRTTLGGYVSPEYRKPMEIAKELDPSTAVLQYSIGKEEGWLLLLTRSGVTAHKIDTNIRALPETLARQSPTLSQLVEAWEKRRQQVGLDGLVQLARARAEDLGRREAERHNLVDTAKESEILERLGSVALPESAKEELSKQKIHHLLVMPDGALHYVPFAMLRIKSGTDNSAQYVIEQFAVSYVPAMNILDVIRRQALERVAQRKMGRRALLAFANPIYGSETQPTVLAAMTSDDMVTRLRSFRDEYYKGSGLRLTSLPETEQEAMRVASLFASPKEQRGPVADWPDGEALVCLQAAASEDQAKRLLSGDGKTPRWKYVLFSTHGLADTRNGMLSCVALARPEQDTEQDGFLQAQEILDLSLDTDIVMLSACQTGLGRLSGGEGLVGLASAFFIAGAESVCASLWQVPTGPTTHLAPEFFRQLKAGKSSRAEALRQAQLAVMRQGRSHDGGPADYSSPFCWAAFVLLGEYR